MRASTSQDRKEFDDKDAAIAFLGRIEARATAPSSTTTTTTTTTVPAGTGPGHVSVLRVGAAPRSSASASSRSSSSASGYVLLALSEAPSLPPDLWGFMGAILGLFVVAHVAVRRLGAARRRDPAPARRAAARDRVRHHLAPRPRGARGQARRARPRRSGPRSASPRSSPRSCSCARSATSPATGTRSCCSASSRCCCRSSPGIGVELNGARLWARVGPLTVQPGEAAKVLLVVFFAAYLVEKRELLASGSRRLGRMYLPDPKHLGPLLVPWAASILIMVQQKDLGSSLLFFAVFVAMLYIATNRSAYLAAGTVLFAAAVVIAYQVFGHVQERIDTWLNPWADRQDKGYQLVQSLYGFGSGGFQGTGLGLGRPDVIPVATTDFIFAAIGEELGLLGTVAVVIGSCSSSAARTGSRCRRSARSPSCSPPASRRSSACRRS